MSWGASMKSRRWAAVVLSVACAGTGLAATQASGATPARAAAATAPAAESTAPATSPARAIPIPDPPAPPPLAGQPGTGRVVGFGDHAADLISAAPIPVIVALSPEAAARAELRDRKASRPAWTRAQREAAKQA